ncbi:MAG: hypothetical protein B6D61_13130 [Bacteroidetes bacterium 4484_249]|nr:MAG: hypothetical protein B6D61_13130 [Bacteroidetes bacterium 4484_249]
MKKNRNVSKTKKIILYILGSLTLLSIAVIIFAKIYLGRFAENEIRLQLNQNPNSLYEVVFEDLNVGIINKSITIKNISINPRSFAIDSLNAGNIKTLIQSKIGLIKIKGIQVFEYLKNKDIQIKKIKVKGVETIYLINQEVKAPKHKTSLPLQNIFSKDFTGATIQNIDIKDIALKISDNKAIDKPWFEIDSLSSIINDVVFDKETIGNKLPVSFSNLKLNTGNFSYKSLKYYDISTSEVSFFMEDSSIVLDNFNFKPKYSKEIYNKKIKYENDLFSVSTEKIKLHGLNLDDFIFNNVFRVRSIEILKPDIEISRDKNLPDKPYKYKPLIASLIKKIPITISIDSLLIINGKLSYQEKQHLSPKPGEVNFDPLNITAYNITNDAERIEKDHYLNLYLSSMLMGKGDLDAEISIDLNSSDDHFTAKGKLGRIPGIAFNKMTKNLLLVEIEMGDIQSAEFDFLATDDVSQGEMQIIYKNLKVDVFKTKKDNKESKFMTFVANNAIRKQNLPDDNKYRTGIIFFERDKNKALPNYLWKSIQTGLVSIIAPVASSKQQKTIKKEEKKDIKKNKKGKKKKKKN